MYFEYPKFAKTIIYIVLNIVIQEINTEQIIFKYDMNIKGYSIFESIIIFTMD